jgi:hypothetical protein
MKERPVPATFNRSPRFTYTLQQAERQLAASSRNAASIATRDRYHIISGCLHGAQLSPTNDVVYLHNHESFPCHEFNLPNENEKMTFTSTFKSRFIKR